MHILMNLAREIENGMTLAQIVRHQHRYHEWRRWSVFDILDKYPRDRRALTPADKAALWHIARGELTTMPGGIGLSKTALEYAKELEGTNRVGAIVMHAAATWISRYWLEEESHHEAVYGTLLAEMNEEDEGVPDDDVMRHRGLFPTDNFVRNLMLQACVEVEVAVTYAHAARTTTSPVLRDALTHVMRDEVQHRQYFVSFAQGLIDAGVYPMKDVFAMALHWVRPNGELFGSTREAQANREGYVNWWETVHSEDGSEIAVSARQHFCQEIWEKKTKSILKAVEQATGKRFDTVRDLQRAYTRSLVDKPQDAAPAPNRAAAETLAQVS